jgi:hypothetical protein
MDVLTAEFAADGFPILDDKLHGSVGRDGSRIGVYCDRFLPNAQNRYVGEVECVVQFYGAYDLRVDPNQVVSPGIIEERADRFRNALRNFSEPGTGNRWYYRLERLEYVDDPTGNKTRFEAYIRAFANNNALIETVA